MKASGIKIPPISFLREDQKPETLCVVPFFVTLSPATITSSSLHFGRISATSRRSSLHNDGNRWKETTPAAFLLCVGLPVHRQKLLSGDLLYTGRTSPPTCSSSPTGARPPFTLLLLTWDKDPAGSPSFSVFCRRRPPKVVVWPPFFLPVSILPSTLFLSMCKAVRESFVMFLSFPWLRMIDYAFFRQPHCHRPQWPWWQ